MWEGCARSRCRRARGGRSPGADVAGLSRTYTCHMNGDARVMRHTTCLQVFQCWAPHDPTKHSADLVMNISEFFAMLKARPPTDADTPFL